MDIKKIETQILNLKEGDILILKSPSALSKKQYKRLSLGINHAIEKAGMKGKVHAWLFDGGIELGVLRTK